MRSHQIFTGWLFLVLAVAPAVGQEPQSGWKLPNLNPFSSGGAPKPPTSKPWWDPLGVSNAFSPKQQPAYQPPKPQGPGMLEKMTQGTKDAFTKTADFLNPFDDAQDRPTPAPSRPPTGVNSSFGSQMQGKSASGGGEKSWTSSLPWAGGSAAQNQRDPKDVNSFLSGKRPGF